MAEINFTDTQKEKFPVVHAEVIISCSSRNSKQKASSVSNTKNKGRPDKDAYAKESFYKRKTQPDANNTINWYLAQAPETPDCHKV